MEYKIQLESDIKRDELFGPADGNLRLLRKSTETKITARGQDVIVIGEKEGVVLAVEVIEQMQSRLIKNGTLTEKDVRDLIRQGLNDVKPDSKDTIVVYSHKAVIEPFTQGQSKYIETMLRNDLTFCAGPAGTGKTYLAVAVAVSMLKRKQIEKLREGF